MVFFGFPVFLVVFYGFFFFFTFLGFAEGLARPSRVS